MKTKKLIGLGIVLIFLVACKKDESVEPDLEIPNKTEAVLDSTSYVMEGKLYTASRYSSGWRVENLQSNAKIDSIKNYSHYYISGDKDSVMYAKTFTIYNDGPSINFIFIKKFNKKDLKNSFLYQPNDAKDFYSVGPRNYALDYGRDNSQNGIAISLNNQGSFKTYGSDSFSTPPILSPDVHKNSKFEVISLKKSKSGIYILEARFNATVFNNKNESKTIDNGYLKINLGLLDEK